MAPVYATLDQLIDYLEPDPPPANAERLLRRASERLDELLVGAVYDVDDNDLPVDDDVADALMRATCAQVQYMADGQDETGGKAAFTSVSVGGVSYSRNVSAGGSALQSLPRHAPQAVGILQVEGLLPVAPGHD